MKTLNASVPVPAAEASGWWRRVEAMLDKASERLNPILVKESRQALKSRQFLSTFTLLLIAGWGWSLAGVAILTPEVYYVPGGMFMLIGYFFVIAVPLIIVAPFSTFRSLAGELEDGTFELVSITNLAARQIVTGKLGSAVVQMIVYYSALSPCIAFTYLLRGVDLLTIAFVLTGTFAVSLGLSALALLLATVTRDRYWQALLSVLLLLGLLFVGFLWSTLVFNWLGYGQVSYDSVEFWLAMGSVATLYVSYLVLVLEAASAQISFASDNRSTRLRVVMMAQQFLWTAWMLFFWAREQAEEILYIYCTFAGIHWAVAGSLLIGELGELSPRVRRSLPQSWLGRMLLTWFNPGSGTGYVFAVTNLAAVAIVANIAGFAAQLLGLDRAAPDDLNLAWFGLLMVGYFTAYLGVGRLLALLINRFYSFGLSLPFLLNVLLMLGGAALPFFVQLALTGFMEPSYTELQFTNWMWTLVECAEGGIGAYPLVILAVVLIAALVALANLPSIARETVQPREATPTRVVEDELEQHPERAYRRFVPTNPWDTPPEDGWVALAPQGDETKQP